MPDAPMLDDGRVVRFESWEAHIRQKLQANADHFPEALHRMIYIQSRYKGKAAIHIAPRISGNDEDQYADDEEILTHLRGVFANPNRIAESYAQYKELAMKPKDHFNDFYAEFSRLAGEAKIPMIHRKRDLYSKLPYLLQNQIISAVNKETTDLDKFVRKCQSASYDIGLIQKGRSLGGGAITTSSTLRSSTRSTPLIKKEPLSTSTLTKTFMSAAERSALMKEGRCFYCREPGHMTIECPKKKSTLASVSAAAAATAAVDAQELKDAEELSQSGNANA
jgi:hypothetical protein